LADQTHAINERQNKDLKKKLKLFYKQFSKEIEPQFESRIFEHLYGPETMITQYSQRAKTLIGITKSDDI
jgi:hypothetical protein